MELSNFDGGGAHRRRIVEEFPARGGLEPKAAGLGRSQGTRRSFCAALRRLEGGGAASPWWCGLCSGAGVAVLALGFEGGGAGRDETQGGAGRHL